MKRWFDVWRRKAVELARIEKWLQSRWPIADAVAMAIFLEASAAKAGNVTPAFAFNDMDHSDSW